MIEDCFHLPPVSLTPVMQFELLISPQILEKKFETQACGKLIHEKNLKSKI
jgi:hypothetical protein